MKRSVIALGLLWLSAALLSGIELPGRAVVNDYALLKFDDIAFQWSVYSSNWGVRTLGSQNFIFHDGFPKHTEKRLEIEGDHFGFQCRIEVEAVDDRHLAYHAKFTAEKPVATRCLALIMFYPPSERRTFLVDGHECRIPNTFKGECIVDKTAHEFAVWSNGKKVTFRGKFRLRVQDDRKWDGQNTLVRIYPEMIATQSEQGFLVSDAELNLSIETAERISTPLDLSNVFNRDFSDKTAGDGQGGWTDQGPEMDMRLLPVGCMNVASADFDVVNPAENGGKSCLVMAKGREGLPSGAPVECQSDGRWLYLLHACSNVAEKGQIVGTLTAELDDGTLETRQIRHGIDCADWLFPVNMENAGVAWYGNVKTSFGGLSISQFEFSRPFRQLSFEAENEATWMVVAASTGNRKLELPNTEKMKYILDGLGYTAVEFTGKTIPGTPLDFSTPAEAPAGKYGRIITTEDGHFAFENAPDKRIRLYGPNLIGSANLPPKDCADDFAEKAAAIGYNCVRFHHFEQPICNAGPDGCSTDLNPEAMDKLDYFVSAMKAKGIYITLDLYASRFPLDGDEIEELKDYPKTGGQVLNMMKSLIPVSPSAKENWKKFARNLLTHENPYTGMTLAEDPVLWSVNIVNEGGLIGAWSNCPAAVPIYERLYKEYLEERGLATPENLADRGGLFQAFIMKMEKTYYQELKDFLVNELGCNVLATNSNATYTSAYTDVRYVYDFVDNHFYWDHPTFTQNAWRLPYMFRMISAISKYAECPRVVMPQRIFGKPYTLTEFNYCAPNPHRVECGALVGAYAGLQDWDGMNRFAWSHGEWPMRAQRAPIGFDIVNDPQGQLAERIVHALFVRGDAAPAKNAYAFTFFPERQDNLPVKVDYPNDFTLLGLYGKIGSMTDGKAPKGILGLDLDDDWKASLPSDAAEILDRASRSEPIVSSTGEIAIDAKNDTIAVMTPKTEVLCLEGELEGRIMTATAAHPFQSIALISLDNLPLHESSKILLLHLPDVVGNKINYSDTSHIILKDWGTLPILCRDTTAELSLALPEMKVEALKLDGSLNGEIPTTWQNGRLVFTIDTTARPGCVLAYLLSK